MEIRVSLGKRLSESKAVIFLGFLAAVGTIVDLFFKIPVPVKIVTGPVLIGIAWWLAFEFWPRNPFPLVDSGIDQFRPSFGVDETKQIFQATETEFCYFGVSFSSVLSLFRDWYYSPEREI